MNGRLVVSQACYKQKGQRLKTTKKPLKGVELKNLIEQAESGIKELLDSDMTSYEIGKRSGISNQVIDRYRKGTNIIENMTFKTAKKLLELENVKVGKAPNIQLKGHNKGR